MPNRVGPYRIVETLSEGAITSLHRAEHERLGRVVLLKTLKKGLADKSPFAVALEHEAHMASRLAHVSIVRLLEVSADSPPTWLAFEHLDGVSLALVLERTRHIEVASAVALASEMAQGLGHAHTRHIVHRHIEPRGVVVCRDGRVVFSDLGFSEDDKPPTPSRFDLLENVHGHRYTAPEQIMGEPATPMSDVFSLGAVLYEMLCGRGPWDEGNPSPTELSRRIRSEEPAPLAAPGVRMPRDISAIVLRCLAKRPEERFEDGSALATALEHALDILSPLPVPILVTRALAVAGLGEVLSEDKVRRKKKTAEVERPLRQLTGQLVGLLGMVVVGVIVLEVFLRETEVSRSSEEQLNGSERGFLRVLARPWADVAVDGRPWDVTPIAKPLVVATGRHYVTFKHPNAPDEQREIVVAPGQTVLVDVTMRIERPGGDAGVDANYDAAAATP